MADPRRVGIEGVLVLLHEIPLVDREDEPDPLLHDVPRDVGILGGQPLDGIDDEDEVERLTTLIEEEGSYAVEEDGDGDWYLDETEVWVWGPLEVTDDEGNVRIIIADAEGNVTDFKDE